jgi:hypothetical protein
MGRLVDRVEATNLPAGAFSGAWPNKAPRAYKPKVFAMMPRWISEVPP